jgi:hypothetical protein
MKKNQDKTRCLEEETPRDGARPVLRRAKVSFKKFAPSEITLVPFNLRSKF